MTTFDDRERGFESHFAMEEEIRFKTIGRRNRLLGEWAGALLGKSGDELATYVREVIRSDLALPGDDDVMRKVAVDLEGKATEAEVRAKMDALLIQSRQAVQAGA